MVQPAYFASYQTKTFAVLEATRAIGYFARGVSLLIMTAVAVGRFVLSLAISAIDDQKVRRLSIGRPLDYHRLVIFFRRS